jgi:exosortase
LGGTWTKWLHLALSNERYTYLLLVPLLFAGMIYHSGHQIVASNEDGAKGKLLIAAGVVCWTVANWCLTNSGLIDSFTLAVFGGVTFWVGSFRLCYGRQAWKSARFPILFLYSLVPIPGFLLDRVIGVLQRGSAAVANELLSLSSVQYFREGLSFYFKDLTVVVAEDCSGIRSSITLLLWVTLQAHFSLRSGWRKLLFLSSVFPVVLFKNGLRIATLSFLAVKVDPGFMTGWLHHDGGFVFFGLALLIEIAFCRLLEKSERIESADTRDITLRPAPQIAHEIR